MVLLFLSAGNTADEKQKDINYRIEKIVRKLRKQQVRNDAINKWCNESLRTLNIFE